MTYLSLFSGIEAASAAWHPLGWTPVAFSEIEPFPCAVLAHHYPGVPNYGDVTKHKEWPHADVDVVVGGSPCQAFSVAGLRKGLDDPRGNLTLTYLAVVEQYRPRWVVWENVPGVLSVDGGRVFGAFLGALGELGYGFAYRVLDAQYVRVESHPRAVPQRRRRVFVVGCLGDWRRAAAVLFERESMRRNTPPRREAGKGTAADVAPSIGASGRGFSRTGETRGQDPVVPGTVSSKWAKGTGGPSGDECQNLVCDETSDTLTVGANQTYGRPCGDVVAHSPSAGSLNTSIGRGTGGAHEVDFLVCRADGCGHDFVAHSLRAEGFDASEDGTGRGTPLTVAFEPGGLKRGTAGSQPNESVSPTLRKDMGDNQPAVAFDCFNQVQTGDVVGIVRQQHGTNTNAVHEHGMHVRRLTPRECERLQGFPDDYTLVPYRGKPAADGPRYKALGNSMAVNVMRWIGERIAMVDAIEALP